MKILYAIIRLAFFLILSFTSTALREEDPNERQSLSKKIAEQLTAMASVAPSGNAFTEVASLAGIHYGDMAWGDYDNDGDYDVIVTGDLGTYTSSSPFTKLFKNTAGVFAEDISNPLPQWYEASCDWGDYDNDGDIDLLITGFSDTAPSASAATSIYNNNNGVLTLISTPAIPGAGRGSCNWIDYDNDGDLDVYVEGTHIVGVNTVSDQGHLYRNDGNHVFTASSLSVTGGSQGDGVWADYDNDKDMDLLTTGVGATNTWLQTNNGTAGFTFSGLFGLAFSGAVWGDFDADGDPDLIVSGEVYNSNAGTLNYYKNTGGVLASIGTAGLTAHYGTSITSGDYDNDGDLDILITGFTSPYTSTNTDLYANDGTGYFTQVSNPGFDPVLAGEAKWADIDNDGDLDLILSGGTDANYTGITKIYRNDLNPANAKPSAPSGLSLSQSGSTLTFNWNAATDAQGGKLTYNLRVGTTPHGSELMSSGSDLSTGYHLIAQPGNVQGAISWKIQNNSATNIYWSVQAIDNSLVAGGFASEASYSHLVPLANFATDPGYHKVKLTWTNPNSNGLVTIYRETASTPSPSNAIATSISGTNYVDNTITDGNTYYYYAQAVDSNNNYSTLVSATATPGMFTEMQSLVGIGSAQGRNLWGDYDHDGDYDILVTGSDGSAPTTKLYSNNNGTFTETASPLAALGYSWASWNDFDNDNDLDVLITSSADYSLRTLYNNTNGAFSDVTTSTKLQPNGGFHGWADWDNDGDMDLVVSQNNSSFSTRNDGTAGFSPGFQLEGGNNVRFADYDNDGDQDFVMFGQANSYIIFNNNKGIFTKVQASNLTVSFGFDCAWVDVDSDGKLDLIGTGNYTDGCLKVYKNTGSSFSLLSTAGGLGLMFTSIAVGDYDSDGDPDIALTGISYVSFNSFTKLLSNDGAGHFSEVINSTSLPNVSESTLAWCDYDHDGDLDLLLSGGVDNSNQLITKVYRNNLNINNTAPTVPNGLQGSVGNSSATFKWDASTDAQGGSITYNLRVGTTPNGSEILSPMADIATGMLLTPNMGNVQLNRSWTLSLPPGTYYWSVQSVDGAFASSHFAAEQQLVVDYPATKGIADQTLTYGDTKSIDVGSSFSSASALTYSVAFSTGTIATATIQGTSLTMATLSVGTTTATVTAMAPSGGSNSASFAIKVNKAPLQITADDKTMVYQESFPTYTYKVTGLKLADSEAVITPAPTVTGPSTSTNAGAYPLVVHSGTASNYDIATTNGTLTINKAVGHVTLSALAQNFNNSPRSITVAVTPPGLEVDVTYSGSSTAPSAVGSYDVVATINDVNYEGSATGTLVISAVTAVEDIGKSISVYPNPIKDELYVDGSAFENARVSIVDMLGQEVKMQRLHNTLTAVDCRTLPAGMFLVIVYDASDRKAVITRVVKM
ncbi:MAG TPA: FG-GAP-like repeat-containing protein [Cyclobacteriaceae bacterium]|jgi:hypothetical protein|nr:FG-GAP-like repeat-containing protein [Cyclobacteriaceae bacterium]